jgi:hypothetical protein
MFFDLSTRKTVIMTISLTHTCWPFEDLSIGLWMAQNGPFLHELWPIEQSAKFPQRIPHIISGIERIPHIATGRHIVAMSFSKCHNFCGKWSLWEKIRWIESP